MMDLDDEFPACRFCGLIPPDGCAHTRVTAQPQELRVPIRLLGGVPSHLLGPELPPIFSIPIDTLTGLPIRARR